MRTRSIVLLLVLPLLARPAAGTWSIVLYDTATGEVGLASATCVNGLDLDDGAGVLVVGKGAGQVQAGGDTGVLWRKAIFEGLADGSTAQEIFDSVAPDDPALSGRQIGIASPFDAVTHTGASNVTWAGGVKGQVGTVHYAIQGNIMACAQVINKMEKTLKQTRASMGEVVMEMMLAARSKGGDWRCSCQLELTQSAAGCGCPPDDMLRASSTAYMIVARLGDEDGTCTNPQGCVNGDYYMHLEVKEWLPNGSVPLLYDEFVAFRESWRGHADHLLSEKAIRGGPLPADGRSVAALELSLVDVFESAIGQGGASVRVEHADESAGIATIGAITDRGDGTYSVRLTAGTRTGTDVFRVVVDDGMGPVTLAPFPELEHVAPALTVAGGLDPDAPALAPRLLLDGGVGRAGRPFALVASVAGGPLRAVSFGSLDAAGTARVDLPAWSAPAGFAASLATSWIALGPLDFVSNRIELPAAR